VAGVWGALKLPQRVQADPGRQKHFDVFHFQIVAFSKALAASDAGSILLTDAHKQVILYMFEF